MAGLRLVVSQGTQNIANNTTVVNVVLYATGNGESWDYDDPAGAITIDGTSYSFTADLERDTVERQIATASKTVTHNADGTKTVSVSAYWATNTSAYGTVRASTTKTLTTIPRASSISADKSRILLGETVTFTITKQSPSFTSSIQTRVDNGVDWHDITTKTSATTFSWAAPSYYINYFTTTNLLRVRVVTYSGNTQVGVQEMTPLIVSFSEQYAPSSRVTLTDSSGHLSRFGTWVSGKSVPHAVITVTPSPAGTGVVSCISTPNWESTSYSNTEFDTGIVSGTNSWIDTTATDTKGQSKTVRTQITPIEEWHSPYITSLSVFRTNSSSSTTRDDAGGYVRVVIGYDISPLNNNNSRSLTIRYKAGTSSSWSSTSVTINSYSGTAAKNIQLSAEQTWNFEAVLTDYFDTTKETIDIATNFYLMDWYAATGKGIAFGKVAEADGLDVNLTSKFRKQIKTSFNEAVAMGSYQASASTIPNLCNELRMSSGCAGSANITTAYTRGEISIPTGWYNFIYAPHRSGGNSGADSGDNTSYGLLLLFAGMSAGYDSAQQVFKIRISGAAEATISGQTVQVDYMREVSRILTSADKYVTAQGTIDGANGTWMYRCWSDGFREVWYNNASITITTAGTAVITGWYRATVNQSIATAVRNITGDFADTANVQVTGAASGRFYTSGGIKSSGTAFEAQILAPTTIPAQAYVGWNVYISGYKR